MILNQRKSSAAEPETGLNFWPQKGSNIRGAIATFQAPIGAPKTFAGRTNDFCAFLRPHSDV